LVAAVDAVDVWDSLVDCLVGNVDCCGCFVGCLYVLDMGDWLVVAGLLLVAIGSAILWNC